MPDIFTDMSPIFWGALCVVIVGIIGMIGFLLVRRWKFKKLTIYPVRPQILLALVALSLVAVLAIIMDKDNIGIGAVGGLIALAMRLIEVDGSSGKSRDNEDRE